MVHIVTSPPQRMARKRGQIAAGVDFNKTWRRFTTWLFVSGYLHSHCKILARARLSHKDDNAKTCFLTVHITSIWKTATNTVVLPENIASRHAATVQQRLQQHCHHVKTSCQTVQCISSLRPSVMALKSSLPSTAQVHVATVHVMIF